MKCQFYPKVFISMFFVLAGFFTNGQAFMRTNLYVVAPNENTVLMDGNLTNYDSIYSNDVDMYDAWKMNNFGENLGIIRKNNVLVIERRNTIKKTDTTFFKMWNMQMRNYRLQVIMKNFAQPNLKAFLVDNFFNKKYSVKINDTSYFNFNVTADAGTYEKFRFQLQYEVLALPFEMLSFNGFRSNRDIKLEWNVKNETGIKKYVIEHAADGKNFTDMQVINSKNKEISPYNLTHFMPSNGEHFYRIRVVYLQGDVTYSAIIKVNRFSIATVFPNPVVNKSINISLENTFDKISLQLMDQNGQIINLPLLTNTHVHQAIKVNLPATLAPGIYYLKMSAGFYQQVVPIRLN